MHILFLSRTRGKREREGGGRERGEKIIGVKIFRYMSTTKKRACDEKKKYKISKIVNFQFSDFQIISVLRMTRRIIPAFKGHICLKFLTRLVKIR